MIYVILKSLRFGEGIGKDTGSTALLVVRAVVFASLYVTHTYLCQPDRHSSSWDGFLAGIFAATVFSF